MSSNHPFRSLFVLTALMIGAIPVSFAKDSQGETPDRGVLSKVAASGKANTFIRVVVASGLVEPLTRSKPITIFVPTDEAFAKLPPEVLKGLLEPSGSEKLREILKYHVISGLVKKGDITKEPRPKTLNGAKLTIAANDHGVAVNEATIVEADFLGRNGVVHFIDRILIPPAADLLTTAEKAGKFKLLLAAIKAANLESALQGDGPFTVFAPTDDAFKALGHDTLNELLDPTNRSKLEAILKYHVIAGKISARDAVTAGKAKTLEGQDVVASIKEGRLVINQSNVIATDIETANGMIHVIDKVLAPVPSH